MSARRPLLRIWTVRNLVAVLLLLVATLAVWLALGGDERAVTTNAPSTSAATGTSGPVGRHPPRAEKPADTPEPAADATAPESPSAGTVLRVIRAADETPVVGATVRIRRWWLTEIPERTTDAQGIARFEKRYERARFEVTAPDLARTSGSVDANLDVPQVIEMPALAEGDGRVIDDATGLPIVGARVLAADDSIAFRAGDERWGLLEETTTDTDGVFRLRRLPAGKGTPVGDCVLHVQAPGHVPVELHVEALEQPSWTIRLAHGLRVRGTARAPNGMAIPGVVVHAISESFSTNAPCAPLPVTTDATGRYELDGLRETESYQFWAECDEWQGESKGVIAAIDAEVDVPVRRNAVVSAHVVDATGRPVEMAWVAAVGRKAPRFSIKGAVADASGVAGLRRLAPGTYDIVANRHTAHAKQSVTLGEGEVREVTLVLAEAIRWTVRGHVVDDLGAPVSGEDVELSVGGSLDDVKPDAEGAFTIEGLGPERREIVATRGIFDAAKVVVDGPTDDLRIVVPRRMSVSFTFSPPDQEIDWFPYDADGNLLDNSSGKFEGGRATISVSAESTRVKLTMHGRVPVERAVRGAPGSRIELGRIAFDEGATVTGRVVDADGRPVRASVDVRSENALGFASVKTDAAGGFVAHGISAGDIVVEAEADDYATTRIHAKTHLPEPLVVKLVHGGVVRATFAGAEGMDPESVYLCAYDPAGEEIASRAASELRTFRLPPGKCRIALRAGDAKKGDPDLASVAVDVTEGGVHDVTVRVVR